MEQKDTRFSSFEEVTNYMQEEQNQARGLQEALAEYGVKVTLEEAERLGKHFGEGISSEERIQKMLFNYGIDVTLEEVKNIELLEVSEHHIKYIDKKAGEIICSDYTGFVRDKWNSHTEHCVQLAKCNIEKTFFTENYNAVDHNSMTFSPKKESGQALIEIRKNPDTVLFERAYTNADTKYGKFYLSVEDKRSQYDGGPRFSLQLNSGTYEQGMQQSSEKNLPYNSLFQWEFLSNKKCSRWALGYDVDMIEPKRVIQACYQTFLNGKEVNSPIYSFENEETLDCGVIFINGKLSYHQNKNCASSSFDKCPAFDDLEELDCLSKAYFLIEKNVLARRVSIYKAGRIYKIGNQITFELKNYLGPYESTLFSKIIMSDTSQEFTYEDFQKILSIIDATPLKEKTRLWMKSEINTYLNIHYREKMGVIDLNYDLEKYKFDDVVALLKEQNPSIYVEKMMEFIANNFYMGMEDLLGENPPNQTKPVGLKKKQES